MCKRVFHFSLLLALSLSCLNIVAADKATLKAYYAGINGLNGAQLKTALSQILQQNHQQLAYKTLWEVYKEADVRDDGYIWDIYSGVTNYRPGTDQAGNFKKEGDAYNREHTVPKSWFYDKEPMLTDAHHILPTDGYVNGRRDNYILAEVGTATWTSESDFCKLGPCATKGYQGTVFEPNDEYKGDLARIYFYMATRYEDVIEGWDKGPGASVFCNGSYPGMQQWYVTMLLRWAKTDPVSQKEVDRNDIIAQNWQKNRNPFVDLPQLAEYVWGDSADQAFDLDKALDAVTGIDGLEANEQTPATIVYTIQGVRTESTARKGIYIINGKKVVVK